MLGVENPADRFTKHFTSATRVRELLQRFGREYRAGRPIAAPRLREATGTSKGEQLADSALTVEHARTVQWLGEEFPVAVEVSCRSRH